MRIGLNPAEALPMPVNQSGGERLAEEKKGVTWSGPKRKEEGGIRMQCLSFLSENPDLPAPRKGRGGGNPLLQTYTCMYLRPFVFQSLPYRNHYPWDMQFMGWTERRRAIHAMLRDGLPSI